MAKASMNQSRGKCQQKGESESVSVEEKRGVKRGGGVMSRVAIKFFHHQRDHVCPCVIFLLLA